MKKRKTLYHSINIIGNLLLVCGIPALSILVVTPLIIHLLPITMAVAIPAMCLGALGLGIKSVFKLAVNGYLKKKICSQKIESPYKYCLKKENTKKFSIKKTAIDIAHVINMVEPIYKYILKPIGKYLYNKITSEKEVKKLNNRIDELNENIYKSNINQQQIIKDLQILIDQQKDEIKDLTFRVKDEINKFDDKLKYNSKVIKQQFC